MIGTQLINHRLTQISQIKKDWIKYREMAKIGVNEKTIIINYLKATGLNRAFINFGDHQLRYKRFVGKSQNVFILC